MNRVLAYTAAAQRQIERMDGVDAERIVRALEVFTSSGRGDVKALKGPLRGRYRLRVGKWGIFFRLDQPNRVVVTDVDNRGRAY